MDYRTSEPKRTDLRQSWHNAPPEMKTRDHIHIMERPEAVIITLGQKVFERNGYRHWLTGFLHWMSKDDGLFYFRTSNQPKHKELLYVYLSIGNRIRYRVNLVETMGASTPRFSDQHGDHFGRAWLVTCGPAVRAPYKIPWKGRQGFRYTQKLF